MFFKFNFDEIYNIIDNIKENEIINNQMNQSLELPNRNENQNRIRSEDKRNKFNDDNNIVYVRGSKKRDTINSFVYNIPQKKESSFIRLSRKEPQATEKEEKVALNEIFNFINYKSSNSKDEELDDDFCKKLTIPYKVNKFILLKRI